MNGFFLGPGVERDLDEIWEFIAADNLDAADRVLGRLHDAFWLIAANPAIGHPREDLAGKRPVLFWPVGSYLVIYHAERRPVEVLAVVHGRRDIPRFIARRY